MTFAKKSLGQHFLHDKNICQKIVDLLEIQEKDEVLEIGPGTGALTNIIKTMPCKSFTILEKDDRFAELHAQDKEEHIEVIHCDALNYDWKKIDKKIKIISNLPYNVASPLMWDIVSLVPCLDKAVFMIQNEVADRCIANVNTKNYGVLSIWLQAYCKVSKDFVVSPRAFNPPPKVDSAVITLIPHKKEKIPKNPKILSEFIKICFQQRRKQIGGILKKTKYGNFSYEMLEEFKISPTARPETITLEEFIHIADYISRC